MLEPPRNQFTLRSATRKFSTTEVDFFHHAKRYVATNIKTPNARRRKYVWPTERVTREFIELKRCSDF
jgi:hypothetical protein